MSEDKHPYSIGALVTVIRAHPANQHWYGLVIDRVFSSGGTPTPEDWNKKYHIRMRILPHNAWYYLVYGPALVNRDKFITEIFTASNLEKQGNC